MSNNAIIISVPDSDKFSLTLNLSKVLSLSISKLTSNARTV